jgi:hypothetical protein
MISKSIVLNTGCTSNLETGCPTQASRLRTHNQNITVAASMMAERKTVGLLS